MRTRFVRKEGGAGEVEFVDVRGKRFPAGMKTETEMGSERGEEIEKEREVKEEEYAIGQVKAGTLVLIHGNLLHQSEQNVSENSRFIYTFHVIEGENEYDRRNWLQPPETGFTKLYDSI